MFDWFFDPSDRVKFYRPILNPISIFGLTQLGVAFLLLAMWPSDPPWFQVGLGTSSFVFAVMIRLFGSDPYERETKAKPEPASDDSAFCADCGKAYELRQSQSGFDPKTGQPRLNFALGCPKADPSKQTEEYEHWLRAGIGHGFRGRRYRWPDCGQTTNTPLLPVAHLHDADVTSTDCPACVDQMLREKVIDLPAARKLLGDLGPTT